MKKKLIILFLLFGLFSVSPAFTLSQAQDFSLTDLSGNTVTLGEYKDKQPVILFFWTTWCPYCVKQLKALDKDYPNIIKDGLDVLAINVGEPKYKVENFMERNKYSFKVLLDKNTDVAEAYNLLGVPTYILLDKTGKVLFHDNDFPDYKKYLQEGSGG